MQSSKAKYKKKKILRVAMCPYNENLYNSLFFFEIFVILEGSIGN
jgi:hypothetical protein